MCICWRHFLHLSQRQILCNLQRVAVRSWAEKSWAGQWPFSSSSEEMCLRQAERNQRGCSSDVSRNLLVYSLLSILHSLPLGNRTQLPQKPVFSSCTRYKDAAFHLFSRHNIQGKRWQRGVFLLYPRNSHSLVLKKWTSLYNAAHSLSSLRLRDFRATFVKHYNVSRLSVPTLRVANWRRFA